MDRPAFVDAHAHLWDLSRPGYDWLRPPFRDDGGWGSPAAIATTYLLDDYLAETAAWNLAGMVHVEAGAGAAQAMAETRWLQATADARGRPDAVVAFAALDDPDLDRLLDFHVGHRAVRGVRHIVNWHTDPALAYTPRDRTGDPAWQAGYARLARHGLSFDLHCYPRQMPGLAALARRHPDVPVVVDHMGLAIARDPGGWDDWRTGLRAFAALPHAAIKLSGAGFLHRGWTADSVRAPVLEAIDLFGPDRVMIATNFPTDRLFGSLDRTLGAYEAILAGFSADERRAMWGRTADRFYRLGLGL
ncbi:amidohydrolase family protein [Sphingomonas sp. Leaf412]|uniref:amidohydrolase family protein n=1 Tax=Sphingomonas sp. Leaf412 TaxID=1736370 RepID=UPI000B175F2C|nr:amidohydrolase family protein [Sphingomonas sp. Leaf412]